MVYKERALTYHNAILTIAIIGLGFSLALSNISAVAAQTKTAQAASESGSIERAPIDSIKAGKVRIIVFVALQPIENAVVAAQGVTATTNTDGSATLSLPEGRHTLAITVPADAFADRAEQEPATVQVEAVDLVADETVEVIATVSPTGALASAQIEGASGQVSAPEEKKPVEVDETKPLGKLAGTIVSVEKNDPIAGAKVVARGSSAEAETDANGHFEMELPSGTYDLSIIHTDFSTQSLQQILIVAGEKKEVRAEMTPASLELDQFVVTAPHIEGGIASLVAERRESTNVTDVIGAEEMSRTGDSDAAGALKRVTGITIVGGKFVYVRGMGERYSSTLLNGQSIPSPEPERRVIPLDLFPTDVLESVVIQKTFSPDMPGEFGGGAVQLRTISYPDGFVFDISGSLGANTETTYQTRPTHRGGSLDWLGVDDGDRALPEEIPTDSKIEPGDRFSEGFTDEERAEFARLLPNSWNVYESTVPINRGLNLSVGDKYMLGSVPLGFVLTGVYDDNYGYEEEQQNWYTASEVAEEGLQATDEYTFRNLERTVSSGTIFNIGSEYLPGQTLKATTLLLRISKISTEIREGYDDNFDNYIYRPRLQFVEQQLLTQQVSGEQKIGPLNNAELDWRYAYSTAFRDEPYRREYFYRDYLANRELADSESDYRLDAGAGVLLKWAKMDEEMHDLGVDYTQPFPIWEKLEAKAKAGAAFLFRDRDYNVLRYTLAEPPTGFSNAELRVDPETGFAPINFDGERGWTLSDNTQGSDQYTANQEIDAGYGMLVFPLIKPLELTGGARVERSNQKVHTFDAFNPENVQNSELDTTDVLPAGTIAWRMTDEMVLRFGYGRTVSRPDLRELSTSRFRDLKKNTVFEGNPDLKRATIDNFDTRWEWYFSTDEFLSIGGFYKIFTDPIEQVIQSGQELSATWANAKGATNLGVELEARRRLEMIHDDLENLYLSLNVAWISSNVDLGEEALASTSVKRPLQGQSPFVVNTQIGFDDSAEKGSGITAAILYNVFGRRIDTAGRVGAPDIYQEPFHQLDLVYGQRLGYGFSLKFKAKNILDLEQIYKQGSRVHKRYKRGRSFSVGLSWRY